MKIFVVFGVFTIILIDELKNSKVPPDTSII